MTKTIRVPSPAAGSGYRVLRGLNGQLTTVPLRDDERALYRLPTMAMDAAIGGPPGSPNFASYNAKDTGGGPVDRFASYNANLATPDGSGDDVDLDTPDGSGDDLGDKIRQLLEGKLDDADLEMLLKLIEGPDDTDAPPSMPAQDRRGRRMGRDQRLTMPTRQQMERLVAEGAARRAERAQKNYSDLCQRFPNMKNARVA